MKRCTEHVPEKDVPKVVAAYKLSKPAPTSVTVSKEKTAGMFTVCADFPDKKAAGQPRSGKKKASKKSKPGN